jgi:peptidoglycan/xylan/chitin deacetylase (PgdA/CDA1 family)
MYEDGKQQHEANSRMLQLRSKNRKLHNINRIKTIVLAIMIILLVGAGFLFYNAYSNILTEIDGLQDEIEVLKDQNIKLEDENNQLQEELDAKLKREEAAAAAEGQKIAYITIDDCPTKYSNAILDTLKDLGVKATFFVNGRDGEDNAAIYNRMFDEGHQVANHSYTHIYNKIYASTDAFMEEVHQLEDLIYSLTGEQMSKVLRFPGGSNNATASAAVLQGITSTLKSEGYNYVDWNCISGDGESNSLTSEQVATTTLSYALSNNSSVILFHSKEATAGALPTIVNTLKQNGYTFDIITEDDTHLPRFTQ